MKILLAIDGSEHSKRVLEEAAKLAKAVPQLEAVLVNVRQWPILYGDLPPLDVAATEAALKRRQDEVLAAAGEQAKALGLKIIATQAASGSPAAEIVRVASECDVDQIVMATRGMGALGNLFLGSVAQRVVHLATVPVLLVK